MARQFSFDDKRVGQGDGQFFKATGTEKRPQRIAYIPGEATNEMLIPSPQLKMRADAGDPDALIQLEDIAKLGETIKDSLKKTPPSAHVWMNENNQKVILYTKTEMVKSFWMEGIGYVAYKEGIPPECFGERPPQDVFGFIMIEYTDLNYEHIPNILPPDRQTDLGGGHKIDFMYDMKAWSINDTKVRAWKEHSRHHALITTDYLVWVEPGKYPKVKFSPVGPATWRKSPALMKRFIKDARKMYVNLPRLIAKDFTVPEIIEMCPETKGKAPDTSQSPSQPIPTEIDFANLLGTPAEETPPEIHHESHHHAIENNPTNGSDGVSGMSAEDAASMLLQDETVQ